MNKPGNCRSKGIHSFGLRSLFELRALNFELPRLVFLAAVALLFSTACNHTDNSYQELRYFYTMLNPVLAHQSAIVDRSYSSVEPVFRVPESSSPLTATATAR
jgi:hypothetical protein